MTIQPITYRSRIAAIATRSRFLLNEPLDQRPNSDPERIFVIFMCAYAGDVLAGVLPGPYTDDDARRFARACLLPNESEDCAGLDVEHAAQRLQIPVDALRVAHRARSSAWALCFGGLG